MENRRVQVTVLTVTKNPDNESDLGHFGGDTSGYYYLPGADYHATHAALQEAGFQFGSTVEDAIESRLARDQEGDEA